MVTRAAKDLLRNTISSVDHHNRILEEQEMWRQWELEQGLTMMVSDDAIRARCQNKKQIQYATLRKDKKTEFYWSKKLMQAEEKDPDRWGHSGFKELYPDESEARPSTREKSTDKDKNKLPAIWDHNGFKELYPEEFRAKCSADIDRTDRKKSCRAINDTIMKYLYGESTTERISPKKKVHKHHKNKCNKRSNQEGSQSDEELLAECRRKKKEKRKQKYGISKIVCSSKTRKKRAKLKKKKRSPNESKGPSKPYTKKRKHDPSSSDDSSKPRLNKQRDDTDQSSDFSRSSSPLPVQMRHKEYPGRDSCSSSSSLHKNGRSLSRETSRSRSPSIGRQRRSSSRESFRTRSVHRKRRRSSSSNSSNEEEIWEEKRT